MTNNLKKNFIWNVVGSILNASTSLFFLILVTRINGIDVAGIFSFAFSTSCLLQVIGIYAGRTYQVTDQDKKITDYDYVFQKIILCIVMIIASIIFSLIRGYDNYKTLVILALVIYKAVEAFSEGIYGIIQKRNELYKVGISLFVKGLLGLIIFGIVDIISNDITISSISLIVTNLLVLIIYDIKNVKKYNLEKKIKKENVISLFKLGIWAFLFTFLTQYVINAPKYAIDTYLSDEQQTIYGIIAMPATLMILCSQFLIHPFLVSLSDSFKNKDFKKFNKIVLKIIFALFILGIIATIVAYFIGIPFLELVYGIELKSYLNCLIYIIVGATIFGISYILCNALTTLRKTFVQVIIFSIDSIFAYLISNYLVKTSYILGACQGYIYTMMFLLILYIIIYIYEINKIKKSGEINE
jgi:O-antigen/teichoic acid export membrane protein